MNQDLDLKKFTFDDECSNNNSIMNQDPLKSDWGDELNNFNDPNKDYLDHNTTNKNGFENEIDKNKSDVYNQNYLSNESTNESTNVSFIVGTIKDFSDFANELKPNICTIIQNENEKYESNENVGQQKIVNEENKFSKTIKIKINSDKDSSFEYDLKITKDDIKNEKDKLNKNSGDTYCHKRDCEGLNLLLNSVKQLDKSVYKLIYQKLNSFKNLYIELKIYGYDNISQFEEKNKKIIKKGNIIRFLNIGSFKLAKNYLNWEIQELKLNIDQLKDLKYIIKECISIKMIDQAFEQPLGTILSNPITKKEVSNFSNIKEDNNIKIIKQLKEINNPLINKLLNTKFSDIFFMYIFGNEELKNKIQNLSFLEDDLKDTGKYFTKNKQLEKEEINKKRLMIKIFAYKFDLPQMIMKSRNRISDNLIQNLEHTNFHQFAVNIKQQFLAKKKKNN